MYLWNCTPVILSALHKQKERGLDKDLTQHSPSHKKHKAHHVDLLWCYRHLPEPPACSPRKSVSSLLLLLWYYPLVPCRIWALICIQKRTGYNSLLGDSSSSLFSCNRLSQVCFSSWLWDGTGLDNLAWVASTLLDALPTLATSRVSISTSLNSYGLGSTSWQKCVSGSKAYGSRILGDLRPRDRSPIIIHDIWYDEKEEADVSLEVNIVHQDLEPTDKSSPEG